MEMPTNGEIMEDSNGELHLMLQKHLRDRSKKVALTKEMLSKQAVQTKQILSKHADKIAKRAEEHERFINKVTYLLSVLGFGTFCFLLGARPQDIPYVYCLLYIIFVPLRWIYYRYKKWHYYLLDFCYYANTIFLIMLLFFPRNEKLFMVCFSFAEGPLAWALIVWRCSLVFNSFDKIVSVFIHLLPGLVFFTIRWWDPVFFEAMHPEGTPRRSSWPYIESKYNLWTWLFVVPLVAYSLWQILYFLIVDVLRRQRLLRDPEVMTSYRELSKKAQKANNLWWRLSGLLGDQNRLFMYILLQAMFTVATMALTVPIFLSYQMHIIFQALKVSAAVWNGGNFLLEVMPRQYIQKEKNRSEAHVLKSPVDQDNTTETNDSPGSTPFTTQHQQDNPVDLDNATGTNDSLGSPTLYTQLDQTAAETTMNGNSSDMHQIGASQ